MGKKSKEPEASSTLQNDNVPASSDIFKSLFGNVDPTAVVSTIFSDNNPFKRNLQDSSGGISNSNLNESPEINNSSVVDKVKRKRNQSKKLDLEKEEEALEVPSVSKKSKIVITKFEKGPKDFSHNEKNLSRKKRKRDDLETQYEAQKYGTVPEDVENVVAVGEKRKKLDNETNMLVSMAEEEGFDNESKLLRTVFVGNLPLKMKKKVLIKEFKQFGEVESVRIRSVPLVDTKIPRKGAVILKKINDSADSVHAYIVFKTEESAEASLSHNLAVVGGNHIRVDRACPPRKKLKGEDASLYDNKRTLFVGNLPFDVKDEEIYQLFLGIKDIESSIEAIRVIRHPHIGLGKGIAYVLFKTREAANLALKKRNLKVRDRELRLSFSKQARTPSKRSTVFKADSPAKRLAVGSKTPERNSGSNTKTSNSYQGLRASKSGSHKKVHSQQHTGVFKKRSKTTQVGEKQRSDKRPAVAARKAKAQAIKDGTVSKQAGKKRKPDFRTPDSNKTKKKAKNFR